MSIMMQEFSEVKLTGGQRYKM